MDISKADISRVLITGGAGFIGSNFIPFFLETRPGVHVVNLDKLTYAGDLDNLKSIENNERYNFIHGDICDRELVEEIFGDYQIDALIHFAAESHVDRSIVDPDSFLKTNIDGTFVLLENARKFWKSASSNSGLYRFHHISTDEVYGSLGDEGFFTEESPYAPNSPYSASKASADFLVRSYYHTYGLNVVTSNCSNNFGPKQHDEKLIPTIIRSAIQGKDIPIYGDGMNIRDWLYVEDHCNAINHIFEKGISGETYLVGADNTCNNLEIAGKICSLLDEIYPVEKGSYADQIKLVADRPGHDYRYAIDASKLKKELKWKPRESFESGILKTIKWYLKKYELR